MPRPRLSSRVRGRNRQLRTAFAASRLGALLALAFAPGMPALGATFSDQVSFSVANQSLWGNAVSSDFLGLPSPLAVKWGTYAGNPASQMFSFDGIRSLTDPVFGSSLGSYGVAASFSSSGTLGLGVSSFLRGGALDYTQTLRPVLSLPDSYTPNTRFTVSAVDSLGSTPRLSASMPLINMYVDAQLKFDASLSATGCFISCTGTTQNFSIGPGPLQVVSWDSGRSPAAMVAGQSFPSLVAGVTSAIALPLPGGGTAAVGSLKVIDSFPNGCDSSGVGAVHCGTNILSGKVDLSALASVYGAPVKVDRSFAGINFKSNLLEVTLAPDMWVDLDLKLDAPVFTRLVFDKPVTEFLANGQSVLHTDGVVNFAMGSSVTLAFGSQVGTLIKRTYYLADPSFTASVATLASLKLDSRVGCGFSLSAFGTNVVPDTTGNCLTSDSTTLSTGKNTVYNGSASLNTVYTAATYQGLGSSNVLNLTGVYGPGNPVTNAGAGSLASVAAGQSATITGVGARWTNTRAAQTSIAGSLRLEAGGLLDNSEGGSLVIDGGAVLTTAGFDAAYALSELRNSKSATAGAAPAVITNFGRIVADGRVTNSGTINNFGDFTLNAVIYSFNGGVFNNGAGGRLIIGNDLYTLTLGSADAGTINLLPDSKLVVNGSFAVAAGYKQINEGEISVAPTVTNAGFSIYGELQFGNGSVYGGMAQGELKTFGISGGVVSFMRSDDISFSSLISGSGSVVKRGDNALTFTANQTYTGPTTIEGGRLVLAGQTRSSEFRISANASLAFDVPTDRDNAANSRFTGGGNLEKTGAGTLRWGTSQAVFALDAGAQINVQGGMFVAGSSANDDWSQNKAGLFVAGGATFWGAENNVRVDALGGSGRIASGYNGAGYEVFRFGVAGGSSTFAGVLADTDAANRHIGSFAKEGAGIQTLTGENTFTGTLSILGGQVIVGDGGTRGSLATSLINNQAELSFARSDDVRFDGLITGSGNVTKLGSGTLTLTQTPAFVFTPYTGVTSVRTGTLVLAGMDRSRLHDIAQGAVLELQVASETRDGTVATQFSGQGTLRKTGAGQSVWSSSAATFAMSAGSLIDVQAGSFTAGSFGNEDWRLNQSALRVAAGASFSGVEANVRVDGLSGVGRISSGFAGAGYSSFTIGVADGSGDFAGVLADSGAGNAATFVKAGSGTQVLRGASTFSGGLRIEGGTLALAGGANRLPTGITVLISNGATLDLGGQAQTLTGLGQPDMRVVGNLGAGSLFTSNGVFLQSGRFDATLQGGGSIQLQRLWIGGDASATVLLNGVNDMVQSTDHNQVVIGHGTTGAAGTVRVGNARALAAATEGVQVYAGTLDLNGVTAVRARDIALLGGVTSALVNEDTTRTASFAQGVVLGTAAASRMGGGGDLVLSGPVSGPGGIMKTGAGRLVLAGANSFAGGTAVTAGVLSVATDASLGTGALRMQGGTLANTSAFVTARQVALDTAGGVFDTTGGYLTFNSNLTGTGGVTKIGGDILTLAGAHTYTGATAITAGTLKFSANGATASRVASSSIAVGSGARLIFADSQTYAGNITGAGQLMHEFSGTTTLTGSATHTGGTAVIGGTLQVGDGGNSGALMGGVALSGGGTLAFNRRDALLMAGAIGGDGDVVQRGAGVLTLSGVSTYTGATRVQSGALTVNGSVAQSAVTVEAGAVLGGGGQVGALTVAGVLSPGNSPGLLAARATTFAGGGSYLWEVNNALGTAGVGYDTLDVTGAITVGSTAVSPFTIRLRSLLPDNSAGAVSGFDARQDYRFSLVRASGGVLGNAAGSFLIDSSGFSNGLLGGQWFVATSATGLDLVFQAAAVPEPQSAAMLLAGLAALAALRRRRLHAP